MEKLTIIKIGGNIINNKVALENVLSKIAKRDSPTILVHGGGRSANVLAKKMGITPQMIGGRRITDDETLDLVVMVYAGLLNKNITAQLQSYSCNAIGISGADLNIIQAHKRIVKDIDYGWAGDIDYINHKALSQLLQIPATPVVCAITHDKNGQLLNTNADTIASSLATAMANEYEVHLKLIFEKNGVLLDINDDNSYLKNLDYATYQDLLAKNKIHDGMIPKLDNAFDAIRKGVSSITIGPADILKENTNFGTTIS